MIAVAAAIGVLLAAAAAGAVVIGAQQAAGQRVWRYAAYDRTGGTWREVSGTLQAPSESEARAQLLARGYLVEDLAEAPWWRQLAAIERVSLRKRIPYSELADMAKALESYVQAGVPTQDAIAVYIRQRPRNMCRAVLGKVYEQIRGGRTRLEDAFESQADAFGQEIVAMIRAGAGSQGTLEPVFAEIATIADKRASIQRQWRRAMTYPAVVMVVVVGVLGFLLGYVVPQFQSIYAMLHSKLPPLTALVVGVSRLLFGHAYVLAVLAVAAAIGVVQLRRSERGRLWWDRMVLRLPVFGSVFTRAALGRAMATLSGLINVDVPTQEALALAIPAAANRHIEAVLTDIAGQLGTQSLQDAVAAHQRDLPESLVSFVEVGASTGDLGSMLQRYARIAEREVESAVGALTSIIEPLLVVAVGAVTAVIVLAMYEPMFNMVRLIRS